MVELQPAAPVVPLGQGRKVITTTVAGAGLGCVAVALATEESEGTSRGNKCLAGALVGGSVGLAIGLWRNR